MAPCPDCGEMVRVGSRPKEGLRFTCSNCGASLEIINLEPLELDWAYDDFEPDWESDEDEWDEEDDSVNGRGSDYDY